MKHDLIAQFISCRRQPSWIERDATARRHRQSEEAQTRVVGERVSRLSVPGGAAVTAAVLSDAAAAVAIAKGQEQGQEEEVVITVAPRATTPGGTPIPITDM
jgi:hypothetical protein